MVSRKKTAARAYGSRTFEKGLAVLECLQQQSLPLTIQEVVRATGIERAGVFRLLCTLERRGYVRRLEDKRYAVVARRRRPLVGYIAPLSGNAFRQDLQASIQRAAQEHVFELMLMDNREDDLECSTRNARRLIEASVDLVLAFEPVEAVAHAVSDLLTSAGVPLVAIDSPVEGAIYFGANNFRAGRMAGQTLAQFAVQTWSGQFDHLVLIGSSLSSGRVQARVAGVLVGLQDVFGSVDKTRLIQVDGRAHIDESLAATAALLRKLRPPKRLLISAFNDLSAVGALQAIRAAGREHEVAVVGQNAAQESREELRNRESRLIASIAYFPERYGERLMQLAQSILNREPVPPAVYTEHVVLTPDNIDRHYTRP